MKGRLLGPNDRRDVVEFFAWGTRVGAVAWNPDRRLAAFEYDSEWLRSGVELSPFVAPGRPGVMLFPELVDSSFHGLPGLLAGSLPGQLGRRVIREWVHREGRSDEIASPVGWLSWVGSRGVGALEFRPDRLPSIPTFEVDVAQLADSADLILAADQSGTQLSSRRLTELLALTSSVGGDDHGTATVRWDPRAKTALSATPKEPLDAESWLITLDRGRGFGGTTGSGRVEYAYSLMAADAGIDVGQSRLLVDGTGRAHFMTRRFDRTATGKVHVQSLAALKHSDRAGGGCSYEEALSTAQALGVGARSVSQLYRRMVFNVVAQNRDHDSRKVAFLMDRGGRWTLAPAFDVAWSNGPDGRLAMSVNGKVGGVTRHDLRRVGQRFGVRDSNGIIETVVSIVAAWDEYAEYAEVPSESRRAIAATHHLER